LETSKGNLRIGSFKKKFEDRKLQEETRKSEASRRNLKIGNFKKKLENWLLQKET
jgi:hypothetical protein